MLLSNLADTIHMFLLSTWDVASAIGEKNWFFMFINFELNLNSHMWLMATILDSQLSVIITIFLLVSHNHSSLPKAQLIF